MTKQRHRLSSVSTRRCLRTHEADHGPHVIGWPLLIAESAVSFRVFVVELTKAHRRSRPNHLVERPYLILLARLSLSPDGLAIDSLPKVRTPTYEPGSPQCGYHADDVRKRSCCVDGSVSGGRCQLSPHSVLVVKNLPCSGLGKCRIFCEN